MLLGKANFLLHDLPYIYFLLKKNAGSHWISFNIFAIYASSACFWRKKCKSHLKSHLVIIWKCFFSDTQLVNKQISLICWADTVEREGGFLNRNVFSVWGLLSRKVCVANICVLCLALSLFHVARFPGWELKEGRVNLSGSINRGTCPSTAEDLFRDLHITEKITKLR